MTTVASALALSLSSVDVRAQESSETGKRSLIITSGPIPESLRSKVYTKPIEVREITAQDILSDGYYDGQSTLISDQVRELAVNLGQIQSRVTDVASQLNQLQRTNETRSAEYFANIATINTQLQSGTTPGNPRLIRRLNDAEQNLEALSGSLTELNSIAVSADGVASEATFLLQNTRAAYSVSGAVEEDHVKLNEIEDSINTTMVLIERVLNGVNDDITRLSAYLTSEREDLRLISLAVANGDLYGKSLSNMRFASLAPFPGSVSSDGIEPLAASPIEQVAPATLDGPRALAKIKFDRPDVQFEQPIYMAVTEALKRYPDARFDLVAVNPSSGNAAEVAIESTRARRNAEKVLRTLTQMGLSPERIDISYNESATAASSEVHLFVKQ